jgi:NAD(P)-dependent dehydrogenase (short-subunit alcohol dehydrogenase family)
MDGGRRANWAVVGRPLCRRPGVCITGETRSQKGASDVAEEQGCGDLRSRWRDRRCCRTRLWVCGGHPVLTGRELAPVEVVAKHVVSAGGSAEAAEVDALDEQAIESHLQSVIDKAGRVDVSFNAIGIPNAKIVGVPLIELDVEQFSQPIAAYTRSYFLTARLAARHMVPNRSGVIMTVTALHSRIGIPLVGGYGPAQAAKEALTRDLSAELAPQGIRVVGLRPQGLPESRTIKEAYEPRAKASGMTWEQWLESLASRTHPRRLMTLEEMASTAVFMASDKASGMTGTTVNLTMGSLDD